MYENNYTALLYSYSNKDYAILAEEQINQYEIGKLETNSKTTFNCWFLRNLQSNEGKIVFQQMMLKQLNTYRQIKIYLNLTYKI